MSNNQANDLASYTIQVSNTYPQPVTCTVFIKSSTGGPVPLPLLSLVPNSMQSPGSGDTDSVQITYPPPTGGLPQTVTIPYGAPIDPNRRLNVLWNTSPTTQVIVIIETGSGDD